VEPVSEQPLPPEQTVAEATRLLVAGRPFSAHEVFEARWKDGPVAERDLWQGLAQLCVALTHARRGNATGAERLVERSASHLAEYSARGGPTYGIDVQDWLARTREEVRRSG
jgi:predicted metal-dependent hydrolase